MTSVNLTDDGLRCSRCGLIPIDESDTERNHAWNHLLEKHLDEFAAAPEQRPSVRTARAFR